MQDVSIYVASYVRRLLADEKRRGMMVMELMAHRPFVEEEVLAVNETLGKFSSEAISEAVGEYMSKVASIVLAHGGDIVKFLVLLTCPTHDLDLKRWSDAINLHTSDLDRGVYESRGSMTEEGEKLRFGLHVAVTVGVVERVVVGDLESRLDFFVRGRCLEDLGVALEEAKSGELGISAAVLDALPYLDRKRTTSSGNLVVKGPDLIKLSQSLIETSGKHSPQKPLHNLQTLSPPPPSPQILHLTQKFVNKSILFRLRSHSSTSIHSGTSPTVPDPTSTKPKPPGTEIRNEYRTVSVLFVKFVREVETLETQRILEVLLEKVDRFDGVFQQCSVDDKGQTFLACFGLPPFSHEKCGLFAVKAAVAFLSSIGSKANGLSLAVSTGDILFGTVGTQDRKEARLLGDVFNVAARLLNVKRDPRYVAIDSKTMTMVQESYACQDLGKYKIKGKDTSIQIWGISGDLHDRERTSAITKPAVKELIGNVEEFDELCKGVQGWLGGEKEKVVGLVEAVSGMGKSNLLDCFNGYLRNEAVETCIIRGNEVEQSSPYNIIQILFNKLWQYVPDSDLPSDPSTPEEPHQTSTTTRSHDPKQLESNLTIGSRRRSSLMKPLDNRFRQILKRCGEDPSCAFLLAELVSGSETIARTVGGGGRHGGVKAGSLNPVIVKVVRYILDNNRIALLLDDLQWYDRVSLEIICEVAASGSNILLVIFSRPLGSSSIVQNLTFSMNLQLSGMRPAEIEKFLLKSFGKSLNNPEVIDSIFRKTGGNLLQVDTLASFLADKFRKLGSSGRLDLEIPHLIDSVYSSKIETVIMSEFDRLDARFQMILRLASILGQYIALEDVVFLMDAEEPHEGHSVEQLVKDIRRWDTYEFFKIEEEVDYEPTNQIKVNVFFRHITLRNAVYESIALTERQKLHTSVAERYERFVTEHPEERKLTLPLIYHHYWRSSILNKIVDTGIELGFIFLEDDLFNEASKALLEIVELTSQRSSEASKTELLNKRLRAEVLSKLAWSSTSILPFEKVRQYAIEALELSGVSWPRNSRGLAKCIGTGLLKFVTLWIRTNGGLSHKVQWQRSVKPPRLGTIELSLSTLMILANLDSSFQAEYKPLVLVWRLLYCLQNSASNPENWFSGMALASFLLARSRMGCKISTILLKKCARMRKKYPGIAAEGMNLYAIASMNILLSARESLEAAYQNFKYWSERKTPLEIFKAFSPLGHATFIFGEISNVSNRVTTSMAREMLQKDAFWTLAVILNVLNELFWIGNKKLLVEWNNLTTELVVSIPKLTQAIFGYVASMPVLLIGILTDGVDSEYMDTLLSFARDFSSSTIIDNHLSTLLGTIYLFVGVCKLKSSPDVSFDCTRLEYDLSKIENMCRKVSSFTPVLEMAHIFARATILYLRSEGKRVVPSLKALLRRKVYLGRFSEGGDLFTIGALICGSIGILSSKDEERRIFSLRAASMFHTMGAELMERWALGRLNSRS
ncbi:hypothetical protein HDU67_007083 [Dinochytrium kinnereticum]|nr:hypothetical protein HDU67_007083 [Dinochytrium kinnereticum]